MPHPHEEIVRRAYEAINRGDVDAFVAEFADDAVWHGSETRVEGAEAIGRIAAGLKEASEGTLRIDLHDVLANDEHAIVLQVTTAERKGRRLADRVVYVFHVRDRKIVEAWFSGDPRIQDEFWSA